MLRRKRASAAADQVRQILQSDTGNPGKNLTTHETKFSDWSPAMKFQTCSYGVEAGALYNVIALTEDLIFVRLGSFGF